MTRHAKGLVIARGLGPLDPPSSPLIEVSSGGLLIPGAADFRFGRIEGSGCGLWIIWVSGARFRVPADGDDSGYEARRYGEDPLGGGIHRLHEASDLRRIPRTRLADLRTKRQEATHPWALNRLGNGFRRVHSQKFQSWK
jgi:hypothetical protein